MKNIVFDLGGVLFARDKNKSTQEFHEFFSFIRSERMPLFWEEYDRGASTLGEVTDILARTTGCPREKCERFLLLSIDMQEPVAPTERLVGDLKAAGYRLYVLSNMSREFIAFLRRFPVYRLFDGEVVSCEEGTVKPEPRIYEIRRRMRRAAPQAAVTIGSDKNKRGRFSPASLCIAVFRRLS